jgi:hypothetical protein
LHRLSVLVYGIGLGLQISKPDDIHVDANRQQIHFLVLDGMTNYDKLKTMPSINDSSSLSKPVLIGRSLLEFSKETEFSARRGAVADIYPYVVIASKRMSARAIAKFLENEHGLKISAVTVAKAIRNPKKYWMFFFDTIEPYANLIQSAHNVAMESFLFDERVFEHFCGTSDPPKHLDALDFDDYQTALGNYHEAVGVIDEKWFGLDHELRREAQIYIEKQLTEFEAQVRKDEE